MSSPSFSAAATAFRVLAKCRRSTRRFQRNRSIPNEILNDILDSTLTAPSGFNLQPTHAILVRDPETKERLANQCMLGGGNIYRTRDASVVAVFLSDLEVTKRIDRIVRLEKEGKSRDPYYLVSLPVVSSFLTGEGEIATKFRNVMTDALSPLQPMPSVEGVEAWGYKNTALMVQTYVLAATSHGLGTCIMEGFDKRRAKDILSIPDRFSLPMMVATGYDWDDKINNEENPTPTPRLNKEEIFFGETFGQILDLENIHNDPLSKNDDG
mmetsp:Transcript_14763/g.21086  ORF Transcript_14763/g.21086 Transcript_14763/m.21086 type:complete len:268 (+) Transcript_14763:122-925(+)|eukprot:CAMPEP_0184866984 /NCGR_PEP_ID=MMETSP0580-20130426/24577_1 /TAXON_ID=1118495 /ORGANISM="Dactyliosolen fragilissimus" /LENGTH=267 /DNA_ID=CAMNT_0027366965 /DNA_START=43 /DNA_END=846 /DNA_ORIENTATION=-